MAESALKECEGEVVFVSRERLARLERDSKILDQVEREWKRAAPYRPPLRKTVGDALDSKARINALLEEAAREHADRQAAIRADAATTTPPAPTGADAAGIRETPERRRRAGR